jgi:hypothetical protein
VGSTNSLVLQYPYENRFGVNQWQAFTVNTNSFAAGLQNWFAPLLAQPWVIGLSQGGCATAGTLLSCFDYVAYYPGVEPINNQSRSSVCSGKNEYCGTPFFHITKVTPQQSAGNQVVLVGASSYTIMQGDLVEVRYRNGFLEAWCKQGSSPVSFATLHSYSVGQWILDSNGNVQEVTTAGVSGATTPTWGTTWTSYAGATTTSGTVTFTYFGTLCPTTTKYTSMIRVADSDLGNPAYVPTGYSQALGTGFPEIWTGVSAPTYSNWSAGTIGYGSGEPCATAGQCQEAGGLVTSGVF